MEKKTTFTHLFAKFIQFLTLAVCVANIPVNASFYNATCVTKNLPKDKKQHVQFFADIHMANTDMSDQVERVLQEIDKNIDTSCVVVELNESCATPEVEEAAKTSQAGLFCHVGNACKQKGVETVCADCRAFLDDQTGKVISFAQHQDKIPVTQFMDILEKEVEEVKEYLPSMHISFWQALQEMCTNPELEDATLQELFEHAEKMNAEKPVVPSKEEIQYFYNTLMDARIIKTIKESGKENIFVIAGGFHTKNVYNHLKENGYDVCCEHGISNKEAVGIYMQHKDNPIELAANMPQVDMEQYFSDMDAHQADEKNTVHVWQPTILT